jgi:hypothetical protein
MAATLKGRFPVSKPTEVVKGDAKGKAPRTGRGIAVQQDDAEAKFEREKHELMLFDFDSVRVRPRRRCRALVLERLGVVIGAIGRSLTGGLHNPALHALSSNSAAV